MKKLKIPPLFLFFILIFSSCVKQLDFSQIEDFSAKPIFESSLVHLTADQIDFFDLVNSVEIPQTLYLTDFTILNSKFVRDNLIRAEFNIEFNNYFDRQFTVNVIFLDQNDIETHTFNPIIIGNKNQIFSQKEIINISGNTAFLSSTKVWVSVELLPSSNGSVLDPNIEQKLEFKSSGIFYLEI
jgi:hypothetical protein